MSDRDKTPVEALAACLRRHPRPGNAQAMLDELRDRYGYHLVRISPDHPDHPDHPDKQAARQRPLGDPE